MKVSAKVAVDFEFDPSGRAVPTVFRIVTYDIDIDDVIRYMGEYVNEYEQEGPEPTWQEHVDDVAVWVVTRHEMERDK